VAAAIILEVIRRVVVEGIADDEGVAHGKIATMIVPRTHRPGFGVDVPEGIAAEPSAVVDVVIAKDEIVTVGQEAGMSSAHQLIVLDDNVAGVIVINAIRDDKAYLAGGVGRETPRRVAPIQDKAIQGLMVGTLDIIEDRIDHHTRADTHALARVGLQDGMRTSGAVGEMEVVFRIYRAGAPCAAPDQQNIAPGHAANAICNRLLGRVDVLRGTTGVARTASRCTHVASHGLAGKDRPEEQEEETYDRDDNRHGGSFSERCGQEGIGRFFVGRG